jgi:hypothetical protein
MEDKMCEIQIVYRVGKKSLTEKDVENFADMMRLGHTYNSHAHGVFSPKGIIYKSNNEKLSEDDIIKAVGKVRPKFLVGHNRNATKGKAENMDNNHPFETEHFIWCHNGGISNEDTIRKLYDYKGKIETDSHALGIILEDKYSKGFKDLIKDVIIPSIEELAGSYSIVLYYKTDNRLFYFKNKTTSFNFGLIKDDDGYVFYGATDFRNIEMEFEETKFGIFKILTQDIIFKEPKHEILYELTDNKMVVVGTFKEEEKAKRYYHMPDTPSHYQFDDGIEDRWMSQEIKAVNTDTYQSKLSTMDYSHKKFYRVLTNALIVKARTLLLKAGYKEDIKFVNREYQKRNSKIVIEYKGRGDTESENDFGFPKEVASGLKEYFSHIGTLNFPFPTTQLANGVYSFKGEIIFLIKEMTTELFTDIKKELSVAIKEFNYLLTKETDAIDEVTSIGLNELATMDIESMSAIGDDMILDEITGKKYLVEKGALTQFYNEYYGYLDRNY